MKPDVIFFDKDGTLMDFDSFWVTVSRYAIKDILNSVDYKSNRADDDTVDDIEDILGLLGVTDNQTDIDGILCKGTYGEIAEIIYNFITKKGFKTDLSFIKSEVLKSYNSNIDKGAVKPACNNIREVLLEIQEMGIKLCVVTTDNKEITNQCLKKLNIYDLFDRIYTDDGKTKPKPDPICINEYCTETNTPKEKIVMVGDTDTDIKFARNAGIPVICVGKENNLKKLEQFADKTISDISYLIKEIKTL